jgi:hypothetical protein
VSARLDVGTGAAVRAGVTARDVGSILAHWYSAGKITNSYNTSSRMMR